MTDRQRLKLMHPRESRDNISMGEHRYICLTLLRTERKAIARMVKRLQELTVDGKLGSAILKALAARGNALK